MKYRRASIVAVFSVFLVVVAACGQRQPSERATPAASPPGGAPVEQGERLYAANCLGCHGGPTGGSMMSIPPVHNANGHTWHHPDCQIVEIVLDGSGQMGDMMREMMGAPEGTPRMPAFRGKLPEEDIAAILAYVKTWWTEDQRAWQASVTGQQC